VVLVERLGNTALWTYRLTEAEHKGQADRKARAETERKDYEAVQIKRRAEKKELNMRSKAVSKYYSPETTDRQRRNLLAKHGWMTPEVLAAAMDGIREVARREIPDELARRVREECSRREAQRSEQEAELRRKAREQRDRAQAETLLKNVALPYATGRWTLLADGGLLFDGLPVSSGQAAPGVLTAASQLLRGKEDR